MFDKLGMIKKKICIPGEPFIEDKIAVDLFKYIDAKPLTEKPTLEIALKITFYVIAIILAVVGNFIVILILLLNKRMRTTTNILILNLAVSDCLVGLFCMWIHLGNEISPQYPFNAFFCKANTFVQVTIVTSSVLTLTIISIERFFAIVFPLKGKLSARTTGISIVISWIVSIAVASPHLIIRKYNEVQWKNRKEIWCDQNWPKIYKDKNCATEEPIKKIYYAVSGIVMYFVPICVMVFAYSIIAIKLMRRKSPGSLVGTTTMLQDRARRKVIKMLLMVFITFVICWTPQQVMLLWAAYEKKENIPEYINTIKYIAVFAAYFNSSINPILYGGFNENFRRGFKEAFKCLLLRKRNRVNPFAAQTGRTIVDSRQGDSAGQIGNSQT